MNEEIENQIGNLTGQDNAAEQTDYKAKYEELSRRLQTERVEEGRLRKANEENAALRREIEELRSRKHEEELVSSISAEDRGDVPDEFVSVAAKIASRASDSRIAEMQERLDRYETEKRSSQVGGLFRMIDEKFPGFRASIGPGGDRKAAWDTYLRFNRRSVEDAVNACDHDTLAYHIGRFYSNDLGVPVPSGVQEGSAVQDPRIQEGGVTVDAGRMSGKIFTQKEIVALYDKCEDLRSQGRFAECRRLSEQIDSALAEGRVS